MKKKRKRLDAVLFERGIFPTKDAAMRAVMAGDVSTTDRRLEKPGELVAIDIELHVRGQKAFASRGGLKLAGGLDYFGIDPTGLHCLDIGCSTGGFTDCLLKRGASHVVAVDVGYGQFDWSLREDARVELFERTNMVDLPGLWPKGSIDLAVCDVSFTSVTTILPATLKMLGEHGAFLTLVKPQFEAAKEDVGDGGIISNPAVWQEAIDKVAAAFEAGGLTVQGYCKSPITGHKGNTEFLLFGNK